MACRRLSALGRQLSRHAIPCGGENSNPEGSEPSTALLSALEAAGADTDLPRIGWAEIASHASAEDLWVVVDGVVYDMTEFIRSDHP